MTNGYYTEDFAGFEGGRASAGQLKQMGQNIQAAFGKLPAEAELKEGRVNYAEATGGPSAFAVALPYPPAANYEDGQEIVVKMPAANTGPVVLSANRLGAKRVLTHEGADLPANFFAAGTILTLRYSDSAARGAGALIVQSGQRGVAGQRGSPYGFAGTYSAPEGPGDGLFGLNAATPAETTAIAMSYLDREGSDLAGYLATFDSYGGPSERGHLIVGNARMIDEGLVFLVTETETHGAPFNWINLTVEHLSGAALPNFDDVYGLQFAPIAPLPPDLARFWAGNRAAFEALTTRDAGRFYAVLE